MLFENIQIKQLLYLKDIDTSNYTTNGPKEFYLLELE